MYDVRINYAFWFSKFITLKKIYRLQSSTIELRKFYNYFYIIIHISSCVTNRFRIFLFCLIIFIEHVKKKFRSLYLMHWCKNYCVAKFMIIVNLYEKRRRKQIIFFIFRFLQFNNSTYNQWIHVIFFCLNALDKILIMIFCL